MQKLVFFLCILCFAFPSNCQYVLNPVSGADGEYITTTVENTTVYKTSALNSMFYFYMYFNCNDVVKNQTVYVEITYLDIGYGKIEIQYNSTSADYDLVSTGYRNFVLNTHTIKTTVFELPNADFRNTQNLECDLRLCTDGTFPMHILSAKLYLSPSPLYLENYEDWISSYNGPVYAGKNLVDATTIEGKVICGYQGWFRAAGDPSGSGWVHYANGNFNDLTVDMWPDMSEYSEDEKYPVLGWTHGNGDQAYLFSSANKKTIVRHFQWMETYGIDGVGLARFISPGNLSHNKELYRISGYVREAANRTGRVFYIFYDISGCDTTQVVNILKDDWEYLVDEMNITDDERYLHENGIPVVGVFGFYSERFSAKLAGEVLDVFQTESKYKAFVIGSGEWWIQNEPDVSWQQIFKRMDGWIPWNVGNYAGEYARTDYWPGDKTTLGSDVEYIPLVYPGFSWDNLSNYESGTSLKPRLQGNFMWKQFIAAKNLNARSVFIAMFDEIDEGTAIFKVTNDIPVNHYFTDYEGLPSDFYLNMAGFATKMLRDGEELPAEMPDFTLLSQPSIPAITNPKYGDTINESMYINWTSSIHSSGIDNYELIINEDTIICNSSNYTINFKEGDYKIRVRAKNGLDNYSGWSEQLIFKMEKKIIVKIMQDRYNLNISAYPNPVTDVIHVNVEGNNFGFLKITVFDLSGKVVGSYKISGNSTTIPFFKMKEGIYFIRICNTNNEFKIFEVIKK